MASICSSSCSAGNELRPTTWQCWPRGGVGISHPYLTLVEPACGHMLVSVLRTSFSTFSVFWLKSELSLKRESSTFNHPCTQTFSQWEGGRKKSTLGYPSFFGIWCEKKPTWRYPFFSWTLGREGGGALLLFGLWGEKKPSWGYPLRTSAQRTPP